MTVLTKRTTVYLEKELHQALRLKAAATERSISEIINQMVRERLAEDAEDLEAIRERAVTQFPEGIGRQELLQDLRAHGKL